MKTFITIILIIFCNIAFSQRWENYQINGQGSSNCRITFVNADVGYILKAVDHPPSQSDFQLFKTTNAGINWTDNPISVFTTQVDYPCFKPAIHFFDENNGYLILLTPYDNNYSALWTYKTTNGGINWSSYQCYTTVENIASSYESLAKVKFINENTGYYLNTRCMYKTTNGGSTWDELLGPQIINGLYSAYEDFKISLLNTDNVYICGSAGGWPFAPVLFKIIGNSPQQIDPDPHTNPIFGLNSLDIIKNGNSEI